MTIRDARKLAHYWVKILGLDDWKAGMTIRWGTKEEMNDDEGTNSGLNFITPEHTKSEIVLERQHDDDEIEHTIVHELLHLVIDGHKVPSTDYDPMHERALNRLATTLIALDRTGKESYGHK